MRQTISFVSLKSSPTDHVAGDGVLHKKTRPLPPSAMSVCTCDARRFQMVNSTVSLKIGIGDPGTIFTRTLNLPSISATDQSHLAPLAPPLIHFLWESHPDLTLGTQLAKIG